MGRLLSLKIAPSHGEYGPPSNTWFLGPTPLQTVRPRLHNTAGCQTGCTTGLTTVLNEQPLFILPVVKPGCTTCLTTGCIHDTAGCQTGCQTNLKTGWMFVCTIQPVVKPVWQPVVSCIQTFNQLSNRVGQTVLVKPCWQPVWQQVVSCKRGLKGISTGSSVSAAITIVTYRLTYRWCYCL